MCVEDIQQTIELGGTSANIFWIEPTASDLSGIATLESRSHNPGSTFPVGQTTVTYVFTDSAGNTATCLFCLEIIQGMVHL